MATVAEPQLVTPTETSHLYMARRQSLRLIRIPRGNFFNQTTGQKEVGVVPGQAVQFHEGVFRVPKEGEVVMEDGRTADAAEIAQWLDGHKLYGDIEEGFWRVDPTAPPVSEDEIERLMDAAMRLDVDTLDEIARQEREGWGRESIINRAEDAAAKVRQAIADQQDPADAPKPKGKPKGGAS